MAGSGCLCPGPAHGCEFIYDETLAGPGPQTSLHGTFRSATLLGPAEGRNLTLLCMLPSYSLGALPMAQLCRMRHTELITSGLLFSALAEWQSLLAHLQKAVGRWRWCMCLEPLRGLAGEIFAMALPSTVPLPTGCHKSVLAATVHACAGRAKGLMSTL